MLMKALLVAALVGAACAQLELGVLSALYYPPPARSTVPPRPHPRALRSYFDRDTAPAEGNDADLYRVKHKMSSPNWTPEVRPRGSARDARSTRQAARKLAKLS